jgi:hypothetical protein
MKFKLGFVAATAALLLAGCDQHEDKGWTADNDTRVCKNADGIRVDDSQCENYAHGGSMSPFMWWYIMRGGYVPYVGSSFANNQYETSSPRYGNSYRSAPSVAPRGAITRGGFGGGFGEGGEGAHSSAGE